MTDFFCDFLNFIESNGKKEVLFLSTGFSLKYAQDNVNHEELSKLLSIIKKTKS